MKKKIILPCILCLGLLTGCELQTLDPSPSTSCDPSISVDVSSEDISSEDVPSGNVSSDISSDIDSTTSTSEAPAVNYGTLEAPLSIAEARAIIATIQKTEPGETKYLTEGTIYAKGIVTKMEQGTNGFKSEIKTGEDTLGLFYINVKEGVKTPKVGDEVIVSGLGQNFNGLYQLVAEKKDEQYIGPYFEAITKEAEVTPDPLPPLEGTIKTIDELVMTPPIESNKEIFIIEGIWHPTGAADDAKGAGRLYDPVSGNSIRVYGLTATSSSIQKRIDGIFQFFNDSTYQSLVAGETKKMAAGDKIKVAGIYNAESWAMNYSCAFVSKVAEASTFEYNVTLAKGENGEATLSAAKGVYGTEITVTTAPAAGYKVDKVLVNGTNVISSAENTYKFNIIVGQYKVEVSFKVPYDFTGKTISYDFTANKNSIPLNADTLLDLFNKSTTDESVVTNIKDVASIYGAKDSEGPKLLGIKGGSGSKDGTFTLVTEAKIKTVKITVAGWKDNEKISVNGTETLLVRTPNQVVVDFTTPTDEIAFKTMRRAVITNIVLICE